MLEVVFLVAFASVLGAFGFVMHWLGVRTGRALQEAEMRDERVKAFNAGIDFALNGRGSSNAESDTPSDRLQ